LAFSASHIDPIVDHQRSAPAVTVGIADRLVVRRIGHLEVGHPKLSEGGGIEAIHLSVDGSKVNTPSHHCWRPPDSRVGIVGEPCGRKCRVDDASAKVDLVKGAATRTAGAYIHSPVH